MPVIARKSKLRRGLTLRGSRDEARKLRGGFLKGLLSFLGPIAKSILPGLANIFIPKVVNNVAKKLNVQPEIAGKVAKVATDVGQQALSGLLDKGMEYAGSGSRRRGKAIAGGSFQIV